MKKKIVDIKPGEVFLMFTSLGTSGYCRFLKLREQNAVNLETFALVQNLDQQKEVEIDSRDTIIFGPSDPFSLSIKK